MIDIVHICQYAIPQVITCGEQLMPIVYMATNKINGHQYIGVTKASLHIRRGQHERCAHYDRKEADMIFLKAIRKYGKEAFDWEVLETHSSYEEALDAEVWFIEMVKPKYNFLPGGGLGRLGIRHTEATKRLMSMHMTGLKRSAEARARMKIAQQNRIRTPEEREANRQRGIQNRTRWLERSWMGPAASSRPVKCLTDDKIYPSVSAAARAYGIHTGALSEHLTGARNRASVGGHKFVYADGSSPVNREDTRRKLTDAQIIEIRRIAPEYTVYELAKRYNVAWVTMRDIIENRSYRHVSA